MHGSWNRAQRSGYKVVRLLFDTREADRRSEVFMTGLCHLRCASLGRPVGIVVANDGSLFVTEDGNGTIWRVSTSGRLQH